MMEKIQTGRKKEGEYDRKKYRSLVKSTLVQFEKTRRKVGRRQPISRLVFSKCPSLEFMNERENVINERRL